MTTPEAPFASPSVPFDWRWFLLSFNGRVSRSHYWLRWTLPFAIAYLIVWALEVWLGLGDQDQFGNPLPGTVTQLFTLVAAWPAIAVSVKRLHDRNRVGWFYLVLFIPFVQLWPAAEIMFLRGTLGPNRFGPDPVIELPPDPGTGA